MIKLYKQNESTIFVECDRDEASWISTQFEFYAPNYMWSPAFKAHVWDGKIRLFNVNDCLLPQGLLLDLIKLLKQNDCDYKIVDPIENGPKISFKSVEKFKKLIKLPKKFKKRNYQTTAVQQLLFYKKMIALSATSSGKSLIAYLFFNLLKYMDDEAKFLLVVPSISLVSQMAGDFKEYAEDWCDFDQYVHQIYSGKEKWTDKPITISTWQSLQKMSKKYFNQFDAIIVDEVHTASAKVLAGIVTKCENAEFKIGMTGTLNECKIDKLQLKGLFGKIVKVARTKDLMKKGYISKLKINGIILNYPKELCRVNKNIGSYEEEVKIINGQTIKHKYICALANSRNKNTLILFRLRKLGIAIKERLESSSKKKIFYVDGTVNVKYREAVRKYCESHDDAIVIASYGTFAVGINIKNLHNVIFAESMKSVIKVLQSVGRLLRLHKSKEFATLFDITDNLTVGKKKNYLLKHFIKRTEYYDNEQLDYNITEVNIK